MSHRCREHFERISEYLDGELDEAVCRRIEAHLRDCEDCRECLRSLEKTIDLCKKASKEEMSLEMKQRLRQKLRGLFEET